MLEKLFGGLRRMPTSICGLHTWPEAVIVKSQRRGARASATTFPIEALPLVFFWDRLRAVSELGVRCAGKVTPGPGGGEDPGHRHSSCGATGGAWGRPHTLQLPVFLKLGESGCRRCFHGQPRGAQSPRRIPPSGHRAGCSPHMRRAAEGVCTLVTGRHHRWARGLNRDKQSI